ncbi:MAG TPA: hypothetical protein PKE57_03280 [Cellvibrionaceae bacterium]|nr:hypothetical protein [Cellvibrionaceae bacterium]HMW49004.1 hypothetical protein [Cellvibrionaceae bacterium]HNG61186.1 hypothetical protein [Cellvibrionaceae bacterium]
MNRTDIQTREQRAKQSNFHISPQQFYDLGLTLWAMQQALRSQIQVTIQKLKSPNHNQIQQVRNTNDHVA